MEFLFVVCVKANPDERAQDDADGDGDRQLAHPLLANRIGKSNNAPLAET